MIRIRCQWCTWLIVADSLSPEMAALADSHVRFHAQQTIADLESMLEEAAGTEE